MLTVTPITWNMMGLDSNDVTKGPNVFPVGMRIANTGDVTATNLSAAFTFTTANANITVDSPSTVTLASLAAGARADVYFNVRITRTSAAKDTTRRYQVTVSGTNFTTVTSPVPREIYVEKLVSQNRNTIAGITGPTTVYVGDTATYVLDGSTSTGGYEQIEAYLTFPSDLFQIVSTATTYTSPTGGTNDKVYADACGWDAVPTSATYRSCIGPANYTGGKAGGSIHTTYTVQVMAAGSVSLTSAIYDFSGSSFHYNSDYGAVPISVTSNLPPVANNDSYTTSEDTARSVAAPGVLANDTTSVGTLTAILLTQPLHGTATLNSNGSFTYTPTANYNGSDSFTYKANNGARDSGAATVALTVTAVNDAPQAANDSAGVNANAGATAIAVLANDSDVDGDTLTISSVTQPANGTVVITAGNTGLTFQPNPGFTGTTSFTYTISDGHAGTATATVTVTVTANIPPTAVDDTATVTEDASAAAIAVLSNDSDGNDDALTISSVTQPANGAVVIASGTSLTFQPAANFNGTTSFTYTISDGRGGTATATVTVTVTPVNDPPVAVDDAAAVVEDAAVAEVAVLANDADIDGDALTISAITQAA
ncbi:MAG TPA: cadherin-like domain-containing protein, partial [Kofleriaceae bacterium]